MVIGGPDYGQLQQWRDDNEGPEHTALRCGGAWYELRDMKIYLRDQMTRRKAGEQPDNDF